MHGGLATLSNNRAENASVPLDISLISFPSHDISPWYWGGVGYTSLQAGQVVKAVDHEVQALTGVASPMTVGHIVMLYDSDGAPMACAVIGRLAYLSSTPPGTQGQRIVYLGASPVRRQSSLAAPGGGSKNTRSRSTCGVAPERPKVRSEWGGA